MPLIQTRALTKLYRMGDSVVRALDGVDLDIESGEFVAITGPSGSGKSTLMHLIGCLDRPTAGQCILNGRDISELSDRELAAVRNKQIGFVFQTFNLINRTTALDNVGVPLFYARKGNTRGPARRALERVELSPRAKHRPSELSGGERQRVAIARAIVNDPLLILADEPTGNLDTRTGAQIMALFRELNEQGVTIILVTHEHDVAIQARRIVQMRDGKILTDRPTTEILRDESPSAGGPRPESAVAATPTNVPVATVLPLPDRDAQTLGPPRMAAGARAAFICGVLAAALSLGGWIAGRILAALPSLSQYDPASGKPPPTSVMLGGVAIALAMFAGLVLGIVALAWGARVRKRIKIEPGNWAGNRRTVWAMILGAAALTPLILGLVGLIWRVVSFMSRTGGGA